MRKGEKIIDIGGLIVVTSLSFTWISTPYENISGFSSEGMFLLAAITYPVLTSFYLTVLMSVLIHLENSASALPWRRFPGGLTPCGIFQSPSFTGTFALCFDFPIQKARCLNQEGTKVETSARAETSAEKESGKILPDNRRAACNPITTRSFNRDTHAKAFHHEA
jgi:hypothetical protein